MAKEDFKLFVKNNPILAKHVSSGSTSWQNLYELYSLYGDASEVWNDYLYEPNTTSSIPKVTKANEEAFKELVNMVKNIDLEKVRHGIEGVQKTISLVQDLGFGKDSSNSSNQYQARPLYQHFED